MSLPSNIQGFSQTIPRRKTDGLKAFVYTTNFGQQPQIQFFTGFGDLKTINFSGCFSDSYLWFVEFADDRLVIFDKPFSGTNRITEYLVDLNTDNWTPTESFAVGVSTSNPQAILRLKNGALVLVSYRHDGSVTLDTTVRNPAMPSFPGVPALPKWVSQTFELEPGSGTIPSINLTLAEGPNDGFIYAHFTRDGSHVVHRARFKLVNGQLELVDYVGDWISDYMFNGIPRDGELCCDMEFPFITSITDWANKRILISYAQSRLIHSETYCQNVNTRPVVIADDGTNRYVVTTCPECIDRSTSICPIFLVGSYIVVAYNYVNPADCNYYWKLWVAQGGAEGKALWCTNPDGSVMTSDFSHYPTWSPDGFFGFKEQDNILTLTELPFLQYKRNGTEMILSWPDLPGLVLQSSSDMIHWSEVQGAASPVIVPLGGEKQFFRLVI